MTLTYENSVTACLKVFLFVDNDNEDIIWNVRKINKQMLHKQGQNHLKR